MKPETQIEEEIRGRLYQKWAIHGMPVSISINEIEEICEALGVDSNYANVAVDNLRDSGFIERSDSRSFKPTFHLIEAVDPKSSDYLANNKIRLNILKFAHESYLKNTDIFLDTDVLGVQFPAISKEILYREVQYLGNRGHLRTDFYTGGHYILRMSPQGKSLLSSQENIEIEYPSNTVHIELNSYDSQLIFKDQLMQFYDLTVVKKKWESVWEEFKAGQDYLDKRDWPGAVGEMYKATESAMRYKLVEKGIAHSKTDTLKGFSDSLVRAGVIPENYKSLFDFIAAIRNPKSHGKGDQADSLPLGEREAHLMRNFTVSLILYLAEIP